jgi:Zn-dependent protease
MPEVLALTIIIFLFSVILHEVAHGMVARYFGDYTAENAGRLTLNPIPHIDLVGSILMPILSINVFGFFFGWAKPVPVNPLHFRDIRLGELWVSAAGPLTNLSIAVIAALIYHLLPPAPSTLISTILKYTVDINALLAIFNLLPIPPLDGSKVLMSYLPYNLLKEYEKITPYGFIIIMALSYLGVLSPIIRVALNFIHTILGV